MIIIQSRINVLESRINQIKTSDLFSDDERDVLIMPNQRELNKLLKIKNTLNTQTN